MTSNTETQASYHYPFSRIHKALSLLLQILSDDSLERELNIRGLAAWADNLNQGLLIGSYMMFHGPYLN